MRKEILLGKKSQGEKGKRKVNLNRKKKSKQKGKDGRAIYLFLTLDSI